MSLCLTLLLRERSDLGMGGSKRDGTYVANNQPRRKSVKGDDAGTLIDAHPERSDTACFLQLLRPAKEAAKQVAMRRHVSAQPQKNADAHDKLRWKTFKLKFCREPRCRDATSVLTH